MGKHRRRKKEFLKEKSVLSLQLIFILFFVIYSIAAFFSWLRGDVGVLFTSLFAEMLLVLLGVFVIWQSFKRKKDFKKVNFFVGWVVALFGLFPIILNLGFLNFLPWTLDFSPNFLMLVVILFFSSIYFAVDRYLAVFQ
jgi:hypothetical protein